MEPRSRRVSAPDAPDIHLLEWSEENVPMLLLHGFGNDAHVWDDFAPRVAPYYRTVAVDLRGHGDSGWDPEHRYDYEFHIEDVERVTRALGVDRMVLVGHSLGGRIASLFGARHPGRLAGFVLVDSGPELDVRGVSRIQFDTARTVEAGPPESVAAYERMLARAYPAARPEALANMARHGLRRRDDGSLERKTDPFFHAGRAAMSEAEAEERERRMSRELWEALGKIPCPSLVVRGAASDILSPECADRMVDEVLPDGRLAVVARASHSVMVDNPEGFAEAVCDFALA